MTPDLPIPEAARTAANDSLAYANLVDTSDGALDYEGSAADLVDIILSAAWPHLRSLQVETQVEVGRLLGRKEALEDFAARCGRRAQLAERVPEPVRSGVREGMIVTWLAAERLAHETAEDATSGRTDPKVDPKLSEEPQAASKRVPEVHKPFPDDGVTYCGWHSGNGVVHEGCGEVWPCSAVRNHRNPNREDA